MANASRKDEQWYDSGWAYKDSFGNVHISRHEVEGGVFVDFPGRCGLPMLDMGEKVFTIFDDDGGIKIGDKDSDFVPLDDPRLYEYIEKVRKVLG